jgi:hypothetical protein
MREGGGSMAQSETLGSIGMARGSVGWTRASEPRGSERTGMRHAGLWAPDRAVGVHGCTTDSVGAWTVGSR